MNQDHISEFFLHLYERNHPTEYRKFTEDTNMSSSRKVELKSLIEAQMALKAMQRLISSVDMNDSDIQKYIRDILKPNVQKIAIGPGTILSLAAEDAVEALTLADLEEQRTKFIPSRFSALWVIPLLLGIYAAIGFLISFILASIVTGILSLLYRAERMLIKKIERARLASKKFLNANLLVLEKVYSTVKIEKKALEESGMPIVGVSKLESMDTAAQADEGFLFDPENPHAEIPEEILDRFIDLSGKKEYKIYSHDYPDGKEISASEFFRRKDVFDPGNEKHLFFIYQEGDDYFNGGTPIRFPIASAGVLKILLRNVSKYVSTLDLYNDLNGTNLSRNDMKKKQRGYIQRAITDLRTATFKKINMCLDVKEKFGYKFTLDGGLIFSLIEKI